MATIKNGIANGFSGRVGKIIGSSWRGIDVMRSSAKHFNDANTPKQQAVRDKFLTIVNFTNGIMGSVIMPVWNDKKMNITGANRFMMENYAVFNEFGEITDYDKLKMTVGTLPSFYFVQPKAIVDKPCVFELNWEMNENDVLAGAEDFVRVMVLDKEDLTNHVIEMQVNALRKDKMCEVDLSRFAGCSLEMYLFGANKEKMRFSASTHFKIDVK